MGAAPVVTVKLVADAPVPAELRTRSSPVVAPVGTVRVSCSVELKVVAAASPFTEVVVEVVKRFPVMITTEPGAPLLGVKLTMAGATPKWVALILETNAVPTLIDPVRAESGTMAVRVVLLTSVKLAAYPG